MGNKDLYLTGTKLNFCPFKEAKNAQVSIDGKVICTFDCPYAKKSTIEKAKEEEKKEHPIQDRFRFRVWNDETGYLDDCGFALNQTGELIGVQPFSTPYIVEQCTGVKDKDGVLIYEGAIIEFNDRDGKIGVVKYVDKDACFGVFVTKELYYNFSNIDIEHTKILGNTHENSELLVEE